MNKTTKKQFKKENYFEKRFEFESKESKIVSDIVSDLNKINQNNETRLMQECYQLKSRQFNNLLNHEKDKVLKHPQLDINYQDHYGVTALMWACQHNPEIAFKLLKNPRLNINDQDQEGNTALMVARLYNPGVAVKMLKNLNINPNLQNIYGYNALMMVCQNDPRFTYNEVAFELLSHPEIELDHKNNEGKKALDIAWDNNHDCFEAIQQKQKSMEKKAIQNNISIDKKMTKNSKML